MGEVRQKRVGRGVGCFGAKTLTSSRGQTIGPIRLNFFQVFPTFSRAIRICFQKNSRTSGKVYGCGYFLFFSKKRLFPMLDAFFDPFPTSQLKSVF